MSKPVTEFDRARNGDTDAFAAIMRQYAPIVAACFFGRINDYEDREDLIQEVFIRAYRMLNSVRDPGRLGPWLSAIAKNVLADALRRRQKMDRIREAAEREYSRTLGTDRKRVHTDDAPARELEALVTELIGAQGIRYRQVLYLRLFEERTSREIADLLGIKESAARMRLKKGLEVLRRGLQRRGVRREDVLSTSGGAATDPTP